MVNPNYTKINAKDQVNREDSVFKYYQKLIKLRHESELIVYGTYDLILDDDKDIYAYIRTLGDEKLIVYCNFSENTREVELPEEFVNKKFLSLITVMQKQTKNHSQTLRSNRNPEIIFRAGLLSDIFDDSLIFCIFNYYHSLPNDL